ncbi:MAG: 50S ribosomal protein L23 [Gammaproteobacteria bacterium]|nr:50S ribosomal protein L23 [Gammaproteobacteria bacterium]
MNQERLMKILLSPHVSEKSTMAADRDRQFVFKVSSDATKPEVKKAVELMFDVEVQGVQIMNVKGKSKQSGRISGRRSGWKKAYVTLRPDNDIDFMGMGS